MEKNIHNVMVNASQIKMLFGMDAKRAKELMGGNKQIPITSVSKKLDKFRSFDDRFDGKDKVTVLFDQIQKKGLPDSIKNKVLNNKSCIKKKCLVGTFSVFNQMLSDEQLERLRAGLRYKHDFLYNKNGLTS